MLDLHINELNRQLNNMIQLGKVEDVDLETAKVKVRINSEIVSSTGICTDWLPWLSLSAGDNVLTWESITKN